eukprot:Hpha_TRINITY_DN15570_c5_g2::TRINITY_DN15570_c5_g2_i1::g.107299::m.107299/K01883/CARS, cysS; cysteinyl-tRNA synthetase
MIAEGSSPHGPHDTSYFVRTTSREQPWVRGAAGEADDSPDSQGRPLRRGPPPSAPKGEECASQLRVSNSLHSHEGLTDFTASVGGKAVLTWYACGPTVYDVAHLGHARTYVSFDIIRRVLEGHFHRRVHMVMGLTDVDDKIVIRSRQINALVNEGWQWEDARTALAHVPPDVNPDDIIKVAAEVLARGGSTRLSPEEARATVPEVGLVPSSPTAAVVNEGLDTSPLTREMERRFWGNMARLDVRFPRAVTRCTEHIPEVISFCERLIERGYAYESNGSVYFNTEAFHRCPHHQYAKLVPSAADDPALTAAGEGALSRCPQGEKRSGRDFALWKRSGPDEPMWRSPWGLGRPGWHVECAAMASKALGERIDVHSGGEDLKFPHHDNELAAAEAYWGHSNWVGSFLHSGHLHVDGRKMGKSLRNCVSIEAALRHYSSQQLRWLFVLHKYDAPLMFGENSMQKALQEEQFWVAFLLKLRQHRKKVGEPSAGVWAQRWSPLEQELSVRLSETQRVVHEALCDNFDTPLVVAHLRELAVATEAYIVARESSTGDSFVRLLLLDDINGFCRGTLALFGLQCDVDGGPSHQRSDEWFEV